MLRTAGAETATTTLGPCHTETWAHKSCRKGSCTLDAAVNSVQKGTSDAIWTMNAYLWYIRLFVQKTKNKYIGTDTASGTRDFRPDDMVLRQNVLDKIVKIFQQHGAEMIDTPVYERKVSRTFIKLTHIKLKFSSTTNASVTVPICRKCWSDMATIQSWYSIWQTRMASRWPCGMIWLCHWQDTWPPRI